MVGVDTYYYASRDRGLDGRPEGRYTMLDAGCMGHLFLSMASDGLGVSGDTHL